MVEEELIKVTVPAPKEEAPKAAVAASGEAAEAANVAEEALPRCS